MGVPAFFRWVLEKYPKTVVDCIEQRAVVLEGENHYELVDASAPNPNGFEVDNLYIDMNGLIHPCAHPEHGEPPKTEEEMYLRVMQYVDRLFAAVRPRRVLYLAIDGVAPRAKMNQQRARRFRAAQEARQRQEVEQEAIEYMKALGHSVEDKQSKAWDSNVITPGTKFMSKLAKYMRFYIRDRVNNNDAWKSIKVIFSDAGVPGEGEHKLMSYIRVQRSQPGYDPNQHHVLHGLDADLIMLGLATHEVKFSILREEVLFGKAKYDKERAAQVSLDANGVPQHNAKRKRGEFGEHDGDLQAMDQKPLQFLHISTLREYLQIEFEPLASILPFAYDFERVIDDFVFLCFFVGNDFLPHLPSLDIRDGALDFLILIYAKLLPALGDYLTHQGEVNLSKVDVILAEVGAVEDVIFRRRAQKQIANDRRRQQQTKLSNSQKDQIAAQAAKADAVEIVKKRRIDQDVMEADKKYGGLSALEAVKARVKEKTEEQLDKYRDEVVDVVKLGEPGWKTRYYEDKLKAQDIEHGGGRERVFQSYIEGLCWVMKYYYSGCASWQWFYPFHYAPFASDLRNIDRFRIEFEEGEPFRPFEQLMGVFPADSGHAIPKPYRWLMTDKESPIIDFYPEDIPVDPNGKAMPWLWVVLLPFIDEQRLLAAMEPGNQQLSDAEKKRNERFGKEVVFFDAKCPIASTPLPTPETKDEIVVADPKVSNSFFGQLIYCDSLYFPIGCIVPSPQKSQLQLMDIANNRCYSFQYRLPPKAQHVCKLLDGAMVPDPILMTESERRIVIPFFGKANINIVDLAGGAVTAAKNRFAGGYQGGRGPGQFRHQGGYNNSGGGGGGGGRGNNTRGNYRNQSYQQDQQQSNFHNNNLNLHRYEHDSQPQYNQYLTNGFGNWGSQEPRNKRGSYGASSSDASSQHHPRNYGYQSNPPPAYDDRNRRSNYYNNSASSSGGRGAGSSQRGGYDRGYGSGSRSAASGSRAPSNYGGAPSRAPVSVQSAFGGGALPPPRGPPGGLEALKAGLRNMHQQRGNRAAPQGQQQQQQQQQRQLPPTQRRRFDR